MDQAWHLGDIFFTRAEVLLQHGGHVGPELLAWAAQHYAEADRDVQALAQAARAEAHPRFWPAVWRLACQGRTEEAADLLHLHRHYPTGKNSAGAGLRVKG